VIKLCEIWANIYPIFNLVIKTGESRGSSAPATIPSASRSKTTRRMRAGRRRDGSYCGRGLPEVEAKLRPQIPRHRPQSSRVLHRCPGCAAVPCWPGVPCRRLGSYHQPADRWARRQHWSPGRPQRGLEAVAAVLYGQAGAALLNTYHNERHPIGLLTICSRPLPGSAPAWVRASRCHSSTTGR
jgi:hypothetical protein